MEENVEEIGKMALGVLAALAVIPLVITLLQGPFAGAMDMLMAWVI